MRKSGVALGPHTRCAGVITNCKRHPAGATRTSLQTGLLQTAPDPAHRSSATHRVNTHTSNAGYPSHNLPSSYHVRNGYGHPSWRLPGSVRFGSSVQLLQILDSRSPACTSPSTCSRMAESTRPSSKCGIIPYRCCKAG